MGKKSLRNYFWRKIFEPSVGETNYSRNKDAYSRSYKSTKAAIFGTYIQNGQSKIAKEDQIHTTDWKLGELMMKVIRAN